jgi:hypothetical protein
VNWTFNTTVQSWSGANFSGSDGIAPGCLKGEEGGGGLPSFTSPIISLSVAEDDPFSCNIRVTAESEGGDIGGPLTVRLRVSGSSNYDDSTVITLPDDPVGYDSGWLTLGGLFTGTDTVEGVQVDFNVGLDVDPGYPFTVYVDNVYVAETPPVVGGYGFTRSAGGVPGAVMI